MIRENMTKEIKMQNTTRNGMIFINGYRDEETPYKIIDGKRFTLYASGTKADVDKYFYKYKNWIKKNALYRKLKIARGKYGIYLHLTLFNKK